MHAVVVVQFGPVPPIKQITGCMTYIWERGYRLAAIVWAGGNSADAVTMVARGAAQVVVVGFGGRALAGETTAAGGTVEAVHPHPHVVKPYTHAKSLFVQLRERGKSVVEIAQILGETTREVRRNLSE